MSEVQVADCSLLLTLSSVIVKCQCGRIHHAIGYPKQETQYCPQCGWDLKYAEPSTVEAWRAARKA